MRARRLGLIVPSSNTVMEVDFYRRLPDSVTLHTARMYLEETTERGESMMLDEYLPRAVDDLRSARVDVVVFGCTSAGALRGYEYERTLTESIEKTCACRVVSVISAVSARLAALKARTAVVVTPYVDELNVKIRESVEAGGVQVLNIRGLGIDVNFEIAEVDPGRIADLAVSAAQNLNPDVCFISCTNFRGLDAAKEVSRIAGVPVVTSNGAALEQALEYLGCGGGWSKSKHACNGRLRSG